MIPAAFDYHSPGSLAEAIELLGRYGTTPRCSREARASCRS